MKLTQVLCKQHIGRQINKLWYVVRDRTVVQTDTEKHLSSLGIQMKEVTEIIQPKKEFVK